MKVLRLNDRAFASLKKFLPRVQLTGTEAPEFMGVILAIDKATDEPDPVPKIVGPAPAAPVEPEPPQPPGGAA